jgi:hypothetical protein
MNANRPGNRLTANPFLNFLSLSSFNYTPFVCCWLHPTLSLDSVSSLPTPFETFITELMSIKYTSNEENYLWFIYTWARQEKCSVSCDIYLREGSSGAHTKFECFYTREKFETLLAYLRLSVSRLPELELGSNVCTEKIKRESACDTCWKINNKKIEMS